VRRAAKRGIAAAAFLAALAFGVAATSRPPEATPFTTADAALVLSGDVDYLRVKHAAALHRQGKVKAVILTGRGAGGDSADAMREVAIASGVPAEAIVLERESTSTRENLLFARPLIEARGYRRIALVTSRCHLPRAAAVARKAMPDVQWLMAVVEDAGPPARVRRLRVQEWAKLLLYKTLGWA
jgi:uncharacterized SAM-binding protein YcdF (DUF218 family)